VPICTPGTASRVPGIAKLTAIFLSKPHELKTLL
jgi:hypothetical protein